MRIQASFVVVCLVLVGLKGVCCANEKETEAESQPAACTGEHCHIGELQNLIVGDSALNGFLGCMAPCLGEGISEIMNWFKECRTDYKCWLKKAGGKALFCLAKCIATAEKYILPSVTPSVVNFPSYVEHKMSAMGPQTALALTDDEVSAMELSVGKDIMGFLKCLAKCLGTNIANIIPWAVECNVNPVCWALKVGGLALKCVPKCLIGINAEAVHTQLAQYQPPQNAFQAHFQQKYGGQGSIQKSELFVGDTPIHMFIECLSKCTAKPATEITEWLRECRLFPFCWLRKGGFKALQCLEKCETVVGHHLSLPAK